MYSTSFISNEPLMEGYLMGALASISITWIIASAVIAILGIVAMWVMYKKADKPGWGSLIPIYREVLLFQIAGINPWLICLFIIPFVNAIVAIVFAIMIPFKIAKNFGKGTGFGFGLWLLPSIFYLILAFGNAEYIGEEK